jgi:hypothetical protein
MTRADSDRMLERIISNPFTHSSQTPFHIGERNFSMTDYRIGQAVKRAKGGTGVIRAVFMTMEGERRYAVENEGALDFVDEASLLPVSPTDMAAA